MDTALRIELARIALADARDLGEAGTVQEELKFRERVRSLPDPHPYIATGVIERMILAQRRERGERDVLLHLARRLLA